MCLFTYSAYLKLLKEDLQWLYEYNIQPALYTMQDYDRNHPLPGAGYCGPHGRRLLNLAYSIAFVCLLRIDEVLQIEHRHVTLLPSGKLEINLDYRKTSQHGGRCFRKLISLLITHTDILPFILPPMPLEMQHLCVVSAYAEWVRVTNLVDGYVFRKLDSYDRIIQTNEAMVSLMIRKVSSSLHIHHSQLKCS